MDSDLLPERTELSHKVYRLAFAMPGVYKPSTSQRTSFSLDGLANSRAAINGAASGTDRVPHNYGFTARGPIRIPKLIDPRNRIFFMVPNDSSPAPGEDL